MGYTVRLCLTACRPWMPNIPSTLKIQYYFENNTEFLDNTGVARLSPDNAVKFWFRSVNYQEPLLYL